MVVSLFSTLVSPCRFPIKTKTKKVFHKANIKTLKKIKMLKNFIIDTKSLVLTVVQKK